MMSLDSVASVVKHQVSSELDGEAVILNLESGTYFGLDEIGARIWSLLQEPKSIVEIRDTLLDEYEVEADRCEEDLLALLEELKAAGLIESGDESGI